MSELSSKFDLGGAVVRVVPNVFSTMLSFPIAPAPAGTRLSGERVSGTVGIVGDDFSGAFFLHLPETLARRAAVAMLGLSPAEATDTGTVNDTTSELTNMVAGGIKGALHDAGWACGMSTPSIVRGMAFAIEMPRGAKSEIFCFSCQGENLAVEVQLKFN
jgi:CheY-specific phosphatase CheX